MADRVLVPLDGSPQSEAALEYAFREHPEARVSVLHVIDPVEASYDPERSLPGYSTAWYESAKATAEALFEDARARAEEAGVELDATVEVGRPARTIIEFAEEHDADCIVIGSHGRSGVARILLGSVAETVVRRSSVPVTVVR